MVEINNDVIDKDMKLSKENEESKLNSNKIVSVKQVEKKGKGKVKLREKENTTQK